MVTSAVLVAFLSAGICATTAPRSTMTPPSSAPTSEFTFLSFSDSTTGGKIVMTSGEVDEHIIVAQSLGETIEGEIAEEYTITGETIEGEIAEGHTTSSICSTLAKVEADSHAEENREYHSASRAPTVYEFAVLAHIFPFEIHSFVS